MAKEKFLEYTDYNEELDFKRVRYIVNALASHAPSAAKILDIGCGNGNISRALGSLGYQVKGIDFSAKAIAYAKTKNTFSNVQFDVLSAEAIADSEQFDVIICSEVLEHLSQPAQLTATIARILQPGGLLIATVPNGWGPREALITQPVQWLNRTFFKNAITGLKSSLGYSNSTLQSQSEDLTHIQFFTKRAITALIGNAGFKLLNFGHSDFIEHVFPYSILTRRISWLQKLDTRMADMLPSFMVSGFYSVWVRKVG